MYADDIVLLGDTVLELQKKINILKKFCDKWGMEVNLTKTQVIVFRNSGKTTSQRDLHTNLVRSKLLLITVIWG